MRSVSPASLPHRWIVALRADPGTVTAEFSILLPTVLLLLALFLAAIRVAGLQGSLQFEAGQAARHYVITNSTSYSSQGIQFSYMSQGVRHCVTASKSTGLPIIGELELSAQACAAS